MVKVGQMFGLKRLIMTSLFIVMISIFARVFMEWTGKYLLSDNPIRLQQEPIMIYDVK